MFKTCTTILAATIAVAVSACGGSAAPPVQTSTPTTPVTATEAPASTVAAPSTTVAPFSRESRLAVMRCSEAMGSGFALQVSIDATLLATARPLCTEAATQVDADSDTSGTRGSHMAFEMSQLNGALSFADLQVGGDAFDEDGQTMLQDAVDDFDATVGELFG